jgi:hypothetical protein
MNLAFANAPLISETAAAAFNAVERPRLANNAELRHLKLATALEHWHEFIFDHNRLPIEGGRICLHLRLPIKLRLDTTSFTFEAVDWGIKIDAAQVADLPAMLARRFLELFSASENDALTVESRAAYIRISDYINFSQFSVDRSPARYIEGEVITSGQTEIIVEWHDGEKERLRGNITRSLSELIKGDRFSAWVKLNSENHVTHIERISLLPPLPTQHNIVTYAAD